MGAIHIKRGKRVDWEENRTSQAGGSRQWSVRTKPYFDPAETGMMMRVVEYAPGCVVEAHSHAAPEAMYVLDGELKIGADIYGPGDALHIEPNTVYGPLSAGPGGVRFLLLFAGAPGMTPAS